MASIRVIVDHSIQDGSDIIFRTPCDCSDITGLIVYYKNSSGSEVSREFVLKDAHNVDIGNLLDLFASDVLIKVLLDVTKGYAYVLNADTNSYLESKFATTSDLFIESADYPGCYYRYVNGNQEWVNPPMYYKSSGNWEATYLTTERWNNNPVYVKSAASSVSSNDVMIGIPTTIQVTSKATAIDEIISIECMVTTSNGKVYKLPYFDSFDSEGTILYCYAGKSSASDEKLLIHFNYNDTDFVRSIVHVCCIVKYTRYAS